MSNSLDTITIPDLHWIDEIGWTPVAQSDDERSLTGALMIDIGEKQAGRPITLVGGKNWGWMIYETLTQLMAFAAVAGKEMTLTIGTRTFNTMFRHSDGDPIEATPVIQQNPPEPEDNYRDVVIRLMEV